MPTSSRCASTTASAARSSRGTDRSAYPNNGKPRSRGAFFFVRIGVWLADRHRDEMRVVGGLDPHQHVLLAAGLGVLQRAAQFTHRVDALACHIEDHVAG